MTAEDGPDQSAGQNSGPPVGFFDLYGSAGGDELQQVAPGTLGEAEVPDGSVAYAVDSSNDEEQGGPDAGDADPPDAGHGFDPNAVFALGPGAQEHDALMGIDPPGESDGDLGDDPTDGTLDDDDGGQSLIHPPDEPTQADVNRAAQDLHVQSDIQHGMSHMYDSIFPDHSPF
jgi:hypothetical protein